MKKLLITLLCLLPLATMAAKKTTPKEEELDRVAAVVNDEVITETTLDQHMEEMYSQMMRMHTKLPSEDILRKTVLDQLINTRLQLQIAKRNNITLSDEEFHAGIDRIMKQNHMDKKRLEATIKHQGMNYKDFEKQMRETLLIQKIQQAAVHEKIEVTDDEVNEMITKQQQQFTGKQEYHISHILIPLPDEPTTKQLQQAKVHAQQLYRKILNGADFSKIASENSSTDALEGGDLGWRKFAELPTIFTDQLKHMKNNDVAGPLQAANGFHIIKLLGIKTAGKELSKQDVKNFIVHKKMMENVNKWLDKIRGAAYIKIVS